MDLELEGRRGQDAQARPRRRVGRGKLTARERFDEEDSIKVDDLKLKGDNVSLSVKRGERMAEYKGKLVGTKTINGIVNVVVNGQAQEFQWTAERALPKKD